MNKIQSIAKAYVESLRKHPQKHLDLQKALGDFLKKNHLEKQSAAIISAVRKELKFAGHKEKIELHTSRKPSETLLKKVSEKFDVPQDEIEVVIDPELIAGIKIYYKGTVLDGSIKNQLQD